MFGTGFDDLGHLIEDGITSGKIQRKGPVYHIGEQKAKGKPALRELIESSEETRNILMNAPDEKEEE